MKISEDLQFCFYSRKCNLRINFLSNFPFAKEQGLYVRGPQTSLLCILHFLFFDYEYHKKNRA